MKLNIYGELVNKDYLKEIQSLINSVESSDINIIIHGPTTQVISVYKESSLLCLLSNYEGFSNVFAEALCCGLPIVASNIEENSHLVNEPVNGFLVNPECLESIADGIDKYLSLDKKEKYKIGRNNRIKAQSLFNTNNIYSNYIKIIKYDF